eukprot:m.12498 g.12498  ORF g.12498 m.12498 type:complete len:102 (+) comp6917_c0_seq2:66-371(+)
MSVQPTPSIYSLSGYAIPPASPVDLSVNALTEQLAQASFAAPMASPQTNTLYVYQPQQQIPAMMRAAWPHRGLPLELADGFSSDETLSAQRRERSKERLAE